MSRYILDSLVSARKEALDAAELEEAYHARPPYQQNDYVGWINQAKRRSIKQRRLEKMLDALRRGDVYMKMSWSPKA